MQEAASNCAQVIRIARRTVRALRACGGVASAFVSVLVVGSASAQTPFTPTAQELYAAVKDHYRSAQFYQKPYLLGVDLRECVPGTERGQPVFVCSFCTVVLTNGIVGSGDDKRTALQVARRDGSVVMSRAISAAQRSVEPPPGQRGVFIGHRSSWAIGDATDAEILPDPIPAQLGYKARHGLDLFNFNPVVPDNVRERIEADRSLWNQVVNFGTC